MLHEVETTVARTKADAVVFDAAMALVEALRVRIGERVRLLFPEARSVRTMYNEYSHRHVVWQVCAPYGKVLFSRESDGEELYRRPVGASWDEAAFYAAFMVLDDVALMIPLLPAAGTRSVRPRRNHEWTITLPFKPNKRDKPCQ